MKQIMTLVLIFCITSVTCLAKTADRELEPSVQITSDQMKEDLALECANNVYVRGQNDEKVLAYSETKDAESLAKLIALNMPSDEVTFIYTSDRQTYKNLYRRFRYYAGRNYDFNGYRLITGKEGEKEIGGLPVYRIWVMKVVRPKEPVVQQEVRLSGPVTSAFPAIIVDIFRRSHSGHHYPPPGHRRPHRIGHRR